MAEGVAQPILSQNGSTKYSRSQNSIRAAYYRGGTSRAVMLRPEDLPKDRRQWDDIFRGLIGSPDPWGRQLDGLGIGLSSLSKVCIIGSSENPSADVDYTFAAVGVKDPSVDYTANCGNMTFAVGPFALDAGIVAPVPDERGLVTVRILNTNTSKIIHAVFPVVGGEALARGEFSIDGVHGTAAPIRLRFIRPGGSKTSNLLPTGAEVDVFESVRTTCLDAGNPCCFVQATELGIDGSISPQDLDKLHDVKAKLESIRRKAGVKMGLAETEDEIPGSIPKIGIVSAPQDSTSANLIVRAISVGQAHRALPITVALAVAVSAKRTQTVVSECLKGADEGSAIKLLHPSGTLLVDADIAVNGEVDSVTVHSTARRLMEGTAFWK